MSEVLAFGNKSKFVVVRPNNGSPQFLRSAGHAFAWEYCPKLAEHYNDELAAIAIAKRVAGGAIAAEVMVI